MSFFSSLTATNGIIITAVIVYFLKDILVAIIQSVFKYIVNPRVWSQVAADINSSPSRATAEAVQQVRSISEPDVRDENVGKALDLAKQHMQYLLEQKQQSQIQPSGVEMLAVRGVSEEKSASDITSSTSSEPSNLTQQTTEGTPSSDGSGESYGVFAEDEIINVQNESVITVGSASTQPHDISSEYSATMSTDDVSSTKSNDRSDSSGNTSMSLDTTKSAGDSVEILSISSDTPTS